MIEAFLHRMSSNDEGTLGRLTVPALKFTCYAIELPDRNNERNYSRINAGRYLCRWVQSTKFGLCPVLFGVSGRSGILIHSGNYAGDSRKGFLTHSQGCILLGERAVRMSGQRAVMNSKSTVLAFQRAMNRREFYLNVA